MSNQIILSIAQIKEDLGNGITRTPGSTNYIQEIGSIQEKYNLTEKEVTTIFKHPSLKGLKTKKQEDRKIVLVDEEVPQLDQVEEVIESITEAIPTLTRRSRRGGSTVLVDVESSPLVAGTPGELTVGNLTIEDIEAAATEIMRGEGVTYAEGAGVYAQMQNATVTEYSTGGLTEAMVRIEELQRESQNISSPSNSNDLSGMNTNGTTTTIPTSNTVLEEESNSNEDDDEWDDDPDF